MQNDTATEAGAAANQAAANKIAKYDELASTHIFYPVVIETGGTWKHWAVELVHDIGRRAILITGEPRESTFLFQQLSLALQRENAVSFLTPLSPIRRHFSDYLLITMFFEACGFVLVGEITITIIIIIIIIIVGHSTELQRTAAWTA